MTNPKTCRHWVLDGIGGRDIICMSCDVFLDWNNLPFGRIKSDYKYNKRLDLFEYRRRSELSYEERQARDRRLAKYRRRNL